MIRFLDRCNAALADWLVRGRLLWFVLALGLTIAAAVYLIVLQPLKYNRSMEGFFPSSDPGLQLYLQNKEWFGGEATLLVAYQDAELWTPDGMARQQRLVDALKALADQGVKSVNSLVESPVPKKPWETIGQAVKAAPDQVESLKEQVKSTSLYHGVFVADDLKTAAVVVQLQPHFATADDLSNSLEAVRSAARSVLGNAPPREGGPAVVGTHLLIHDVYQYTEADGQRLQIISVLLMGLVIAISFRSIRWVLLPFLVIYAALYWAEALWSMLNGELTMVGSAISALVTVIGVSTVVHYGIHYRELRAELPAAAAMRTTLYDLTPPIFWVLIAIGGGFGALLVCELQPVLDFAWIMLSATLLIGVAALGFLPLGVIGFRPAQQLIPTHQDRMANWLRHSVHTVRRRPWPTTFALVAPAMILGSGIFLLQAQTDFTRNFRTSTEVFQSYDFVETHLGGAGQLDVVFDCPDLLKLSDEDLNAFLEKLSQLEIALGRLHDENDQPIPGVSKVLGLADFIQFFDSSLNSLEQPVASMARGAFPPALRIKVLNGEVGGAEAALDNAKALLQGIGGRLLKADQRERLLDQVSKFRKELERFRRSPPGPHFWNPSAGKMRITLQVQERLDGGTKRRLIAAAQRKAEEILGPAARPQTTGIYVMLVHLIESILEDQRWTTYVALICQLLVGLFAFRSLWLAVITMVPMILPVAAVMGGMGWIGLPINIATAMLASVAMGMAHSSSFLYIYRFTHELRIHRDFDTALSITHGSTGLALVIANVALVLGFGVLGLSSFIPLVDFGLLTGLALFGGLIGNLFLLPLLLSLVPGLTVPSKPDLASSTALPVPPVG